MTWFDDASADGERSAEAPMPERRRSRGVLVAWLLVGGLVVGLLVAGAVSAVAHFVGNQSGDPDTTEGPRAEAALAALACGDPAPPADTDGTGRRTLTAQVDVNDPDLAGTYAAGADLPVIAGLVNVGDEVEVRIESDLAVVVARDGVVTGEPAVVDVRDPDRADPYRMTVPSGIGVTVETSVPLVGCDGEPLPAGEYTLVVGVRVATLEGDTTLDEDTEAAGADAHATELVGESLPFRVE